MKGKAGFTLMEIMVSLVLVGLIAGIAGTSVITATRSYLYARENDVISQKAQLALGRINRELTELSTVKDATGACIVYEGPYGRRAIARVVESDAIYLFTGYGSSNCPSSASGGDILVDGVQTFRILYNPNPGGTASLWSTAQNIRDLFAVRAEMELARADTGGKVPFYLTVSPRNNNNSGGAALPTASNPPPEYSGRQCFVTTAAWGDANHPVVEALRQFRDRVLLQAAPGRALVSVYEDVGPSLAQAIEGRPVACLLVRLLVTPLAGFAVLALACPLLIPLIFFLSWGGARLAVRAMQRRSSRWLPRLQRQGGAMLVTLIAALVIFSALGAVMIAMFGTAALSQASGNSTQRAYYMAESGFRYAASAYANVAGATELAREQARDNLLANELHGRTFSMASGDGAFRFDVYPYYYKVAEVPASNALRTKVTGGFPLEGTEYNNGSWVKVTKTDGTQHYQQISGVSLHTYAGYNEVRFWTYSGNNWDPAKIDTDNTAVTPVAVPDRSNLTVTDSDGDGLIDYIPFVAGSGARAFPLRNGIFTVHVVGLADPMILSYRELDVTNRRLKGIGDPNGLPLTTLTLQDPGSGTPTRFIELTKFIRLDSTGTFGTGSAAVSRKATYSTPIGYAKALPVPKSQSHDQMVNLTGWLTGVDISRIGTATAGTSYGSTMKVGSGQSVYMYPGGSCLKIMEFQVGLNLSTALLTTGAPVYPAIQQEWLRAGDYLSYDLEMKTFYTLVSPMARYGVGLTFRLDDKGNALGVTFARGVPGYDSYGCDNDGIPHGWLYGYPDYTPMLLFWMKQYEKQESGISTDLSPHSVTPTKFDDPPPAGPPATGTYAIASYNPEYYWENGERVRFVNSGGALPPPLIPGRDYYIRKVVYNGTVYLYLFNSVTAALNQTSPYWAGLVDITDYGTGTTTMIAQDPTYTKLAHQVLTSANEYYGLIASLSYLKSWATFATRVIEAPSVSFSGGGGASGREILSGETVYQTADNLPGGTITAVYRVSRAPLYRDSSTGARNWTGNTAQGVLLLERIQGNAKSNPSTSPFTAASKLFVGEHPGGTWVATANVSGDAVFRVRDNWVMLYVGDTTGLSPADTNPYNNYRGPVARNSVLWPPDNPADTVVNTDTFTLVRFGDYVNPYLSCMVNGVNQTGDYCLKGFYSKGNTGSAGDVLRFASPDGVLFYTPSSGTTFPTSRAEVGLHAYGSDAQFAEFDDFGMQFGPGYSITRKGFMMPVQQ